ncbi:MAG: flagellar protein export ATPase FliI [Candidatus Kapabacteria bacterium]|nr:flagellar protein export ATPase FliI [Candidatus Kapabacteria bacterium]
MLATLHSRIAPAIHATRPLELFGRIAQVVGLVIESEGPQVPIGEVLRIRNRSGEFIGSCEVVGFRDNRILSMVLGETTDLMPGMELVATHKPMSVGVGNFLLGRVLDGLGNPIDGKGGFGISEYRSIYAQPPNPLLRKRISEPITTGIRALDGVMTIGKGQRIGIFAGSGVGKSTTLGMIARNTTADINVIALIGERGREVREFIEKDLGEEGLQRSIVVCATSDQPALLRLKAALTATTIAEYFRDQGFDVMLMMDSVTRLAMAQREVGLAVGEPPTAKGYTPSVFALMHKTMERSGTSDIGTITALYTVLVEGDDMNEPIADAARGILDGHVVLSRKLGAQGHYPAIDVLQSLSRVMGDITTKEHRAAASQMKELMALYNDAEDLINVGAYQPGANPRLDRAVRMNDQIRSYLRQSTDESLSYSDSISRLMAMMQ